MDLESASTFWGLPAYSKATMPEKHTNKSCNAASMNSSLCSGLKSWRSENTSVLQASSTASERSPLLMNVKRPCKQKLGTLRKREEVLHLNGIRPLRGLSCPSQTTTQETLESLEIPTYYLLTPSNERTCKRGTFVAVFVVVVVETAPLDGAGEGS